MRMRDEDYTLQSKANLRASIIAAFLSLSDSNASTKERPIFGCQNDACAAAFPPPLTPQSFILDRKKKSYYQIYINQNTHKICCCFEF